MEASECVNELQLWLSAVDLQFLLGRAWPGLRVVLRLQCNYAVTGKLLLALGLNFISECYGVL